MSTPVTELKTTTLKLEMLLVIKFMANSKLMLQYQLPFWQCPCLSGSSNNSRVLSLKIAESKFDTFKHRIMWLRYIKVILGWFPNQWHPMISGGMLRQGALKRSELNSVPAKAQATITKIQSTDKTAKSSLTAGTRKTTRNGVLQLDIQKLCAKWMNSYDVAIYDSIWQLSITVAIYDSYCEYCNSVPLVQLAGCFGADFIQNCLV